MELPTATRGHAPGDATRGPTRSRAATAGPHAAIVETPAGPGADIGKGGDGPLRPLCSTPPDRRTGALAADG